MIGVTISPLIIAQDSLVPESPVSLAGLNVKLLKRTSFV
jgi:hypothetical protein